MKTKKNNKKVQKTKFNFGIFYILCGILAILGFIIFVYNNNGQNYHKLIPVFILGILFIVLGINETLIYKTNKGIIERISKMDKYDRIWILSFIIIFIGIIVGLYIKTKFSYAIIIFGMIWGIVWVNFKDKIIKKKRKKNR